MPRYFQDYLLYTCAVKNHGLLHQYFFPGFAFGNDIKSPNYFGSLLLKRACCTPRFSPTCILEQYSLK